MAVRTYYGTCKTASAESEKKVYVPDTDLIEEFNFQKGDLLVVFFAQTNTVSEPSIVIYLQDPEQEMSTMNDSGKLIKSVDVEANMENAWAAGETVIFAYTQQSISGVYYWELIDGAHATADTYGSMRLPNSEDLGLSWQSSKNIEEYPTQETLGTLSLTGYDSHVNITYPVEGIIQTYVNNEKSYTGQLINNGDGFGNDKTAPPTTESGGMAEPFITRIIPDNLYFGNSNGLYYGTDTSGQPKSRIVLNNDNNYLVIGDSADDTLAGIQIDKNTIINGQLTSTVTVTEQNQNPIGLTTNGIIREKNQALSTRYGPRYIVMTKTTATTDIPTIAAHAVSKKNNSSHLYLSVVEDGWVPIGVVGYNINYKIQDQQGDAMYANLWECHLCRTGEHENQIEYSVLNLKDKPIDIRIAFDVLYKKDLT